MTMSRIATIVVLIVAMVAVFSMGWWYFQQQKAEYKRIASISDAFIQANAVKTKVLGYYFEYKQFPSKNETVGLQAPESFRHGALESITIKKGGHIWLHFNAAAGVSGGSIVFIPTLNFASQKLWQCKTTCFPDIAKHFPECQCVQHLE